MNNKLKESILFLFVLVAISSCTLPEENTSFLVGRVYINKETSDKIEFIEKGKLVITWASCDKPYIENYPYEFEYIIYKDGNGINLIRMSSSEGFFFPYSVLEFSDSKEEIFFTDRNAKTGIFTKQ